MKSTSEIRVALVGCGGVVRKYRGVYFGLPGVRVVSTVDMNLSEAEAAAQELEADKASTAFDDALADDIDAVVISTPNHLHAEQASAALTSGKHVLLQKPMARTIEECDRILDAHRRSGAVLGIYMNLLDNPLFRDLRRMAQANYLGRIGLCSARLAHRGGLSWAGADANWRASREITGGGSLIQLAIHYEHLLRWILKTRVTSVQAYSVNFACPHLEGDDLTLANFELGNGAYACIQTAWCLQDEHFSLMGTKGSIHYRDNRRIEFAGDGGPFDGEVLKLKGNGQIEVLDPCLPPEWDDAQNPYNQHRRFFEALRHGHPPEVTGEDGREDVRIIQACYEAAQEKRTISL